MKITYYITPADSTGWSGILRGVWDVSVPIEVAAQTWPTAGVVNGSHELEHFQGSEADLQALVLCQPLMPGTAITMEDE